MMTVTRSFEETFNPMLLKQAVGLERRQLRSLSLESMKMFVKYFMLST
jgi:hypothetical protein